MARTLTSTSAARAALVTALRVRPGARVTLRDAAARATHGFDEASADDGLEQNRHRLEELQYALFAENRAAMLIVLQGIDTAGKDGTIRHVMTAFNPQGCAVHAFKVPNDAEREHDYLWRAHLQAPPRGSIAVFNRSHYEDVLVVRVDRLVPRTVWERRYQHINDFERLLTDCGTRVVKIFLQVSKAEQKQRLEARLANPRKHWKWDAADVAKRRQWGAYVEAYEAMLTRCATANAPWYVVPSDRKWFRNFAVSGILVHELAQLRPRLPRRVVPARDYRMF